jgi:hypothetical protein
VFKKEMAETRRRLIDRFDSNKAACIARVTAIFCQHVVEIFGTQRILALGFGAWQSVTSKKFVGAKKTRRAGYEPVAAGRTGGRNCLKTFALPEPRPGAMNRQRLKGHL